MSLHGKFQFLLAIFGVSVLANVLVSIWCIHIYMADATSRFNVLMFSVRDTDEIRRLLDELTSELTERGQRRDRRQDARYRYLDQKIATRIGDIAADPTDAARRKSLDTLVSLGAELSSSCERYVALLNEGQDEPAGSLLVERIVPGIVDPMRSVLDRLARDSDIALTRTSAEIGDKETSVTAILSINAALAFLLAAVGVHLVRNWVLKPVDSLKVAAEVHASGDLNYRVKRHSDDELGMLAHAVNRMADSLIEIQARLVQQERMAAIGEVASAVAHNIRNPLASIRASVQASLMELPADSPVRATHEQTIATVDSLSRWLRELLMVSRPIDLERRYVGSGEIVRHVMAVAHHDARRRGISVEFRHPDSDREVYVDAPRIEQALLAVVDNAVEASPADSAVVIEVAGETGSDYVDLRVIDSGAGIDPAVLDRVATPYFSTKPGGTGIGLHLARRIVQAHGGTIDFGNNCGKGATVTLRLPAAEHSVSEV